MGKEYHFQVNLGGMLDILSNHLYKSADIFLRELLQNGTDAVALRKRRESGWDRGAINIRLKPGKKIVFTDNGAGLTKEEIHQFLSVIGQSSKSGILDSRLQEDYIGRFGIGLLSCFMVSDAIVVHTKSIDGKKAYVWKGKPDGTYTLKRLEDSKEGKRQDKDIPTGTSVILTAKEGCEEYFQEGAVTRLVQYYGLMLPIPVYLNKGKKPLNQIPENFMQMGRGKLFAFGEWLFQENFLDVVIFHTKHLSGAAYVLPYKTDSSVKNGHRIYLKNMLLTDQGTPLLPDWAFFLRCFFNTTGLRPTASREGFYEDGELEEARQEFSDTVKQHFRRLSKDNPEVLQKIVSVHYDAIKSMAVWDDEIFDMFIDYLPFVTSEGRMTGIALKHAGSASYIGDVPRFEQLKPVFIAQNRLLICSGYAFDDQLIPKFAKRFHLPVVPLHEEDMGKVLKEVPAESHREAQRMLAAMNEGLKEFDCRADLRSFQPADLPALYSISDDVRFLRQVQGAKESSSGVFSVALSSLLSGNSGKALARLYLNYHNPLVQRLLSVQEDGLLRSMAKVLYVQALAAGGHSLHNKELRTLSRELLYLVDSY